MQGDDYCSLASSGGGTVAAGDTKAFYRLVNRFPPTEKDYESTFARYERKGKFPPRWKKEDFRISRGLSSYDTEDGAKRQWEESTGDQRYIVRYWLPESHSELYERTFPRPGHYTLFAGKDELDPFLDQDFQVALPRR